MKHSNHFGQVLPKTWRPTNRFVKTIPILLFALFLTGKGQAQSNVDSFDPGASDRVRAMALQADGKVVVGGAFTTLGPGGMGITTRNFIGRLNPDGSIDTTFNPGADGQVEVLVIQADGKILVGGSFTTLAGAARSRIGRLNSDGSIDSSFDPGADNFVSALAVQTGRQDPGRRAVPPSRWRRHRHSGALPYRATQFRRLAGHRLRSRCKRPCISYSVTNRR